MVNPVRPTPVLFTSWSSNTEPATPVGDVTSVRSLGLAPVAALNPWAALLAAGLLASMSCAVRPVPGVPPAMAAPPGMPGDGGTEFEPEVLVQSPLAPVMLSRVHPAGGVVPDVPIESKF